MNMKNLWDVKDFLIEDWQKNFLPRIGKDEHWMTFCKNCEQMGSIECNVED